MTTEGSAVAQLMAWKTNWADNLSKWRYVIVQLERGSEGGNLHLQGYCEGTQRRFAAAKKDLAATFPFCLESRFHIEARKGTRDEAQTYCKKEESRVFPFYEVGEWIKGSGARTDLKVYAREIIDHGIDTAIENRPGMFLKYAKGSRELDAWARKGKAKEIRDVRIECVWGDTGTGKTYGAVHWAMDSGKTWWLSGPPSAAQWYAYGYEGEEVVIMDELRGNWMRISALLVLLHEYPYKANASGYFVHWIPRYILLTSNEHPRDWYSADTVGQRSIQALLRRIQKVTRIGRTIGSPISGSAPNWPTARSPTPSERIGGTPTRTQETGRHPGPASPGRSSPEATYRWFE